MKNLLVAILLASALVLGGIAVQQRQKLAQAEAKTAELQRDIEKLQSRIDSQEKQVTEMKGELHTERLVQADRLQAAAAAVQKPAESPTQTNSKPANPFAQMFKNPEMREMVKNQQKTAFSSMIDKNYADLFTTLQLTPDQKAALKDLLLKKMLAGADTGMSLFTDEMDAEKRKEIINQAKTEKENMDAEIKQFLGDDNYAQLQTYEKEQPTRNAVSGLKDQLAKSDNPLTADQQQQLTQALNEERLSFKFTTDYNDHSKYPDDMTSYFSEERLKTFAEEQEKLDERYLTRARSFLSPQQLTAYENFLKNQRELQAMGMKMASTMLAPKK